MTSSGSAREAIRVMRERYRAASGAIIETFLGLAAEMSRTPDSPATIEAVRREAHRVHGTAGTYGFGEASDIASSLERRCAMWATDPSADAGNRSAIVERSARSLAASFAPPAEPESRSADS